MQQPVGPVSDLHDPSEGIVAGRGVRHLGQLRPGDFARFVEVDLATAHAALAEQEYNLRLLRIGLASRLPWVRTDGCSAWT